MSKICYQLVTDPREHTAEFTPPEYSESERRAQFDRLTEENPVSIFEGVSL